MTGNKVILFLSFSVQKGNIFFLQTIVARHIGKVLHWLYDCFYTPPEMAQLAMSMEANRTLLRERPAKENRKVALRIVDDMSMMALERSYRLSYENAHCVSCGSMSRR